MKRISSVRFQISRRNSLTISILKKGIVLKFKIHFLINDAKETSNNHGGITVAGKCKFQEFQILRSTYSLHLDI